MAFWFAIHLEDLASARLLMQEEFLLKQLVACALLNKKGEAADDSELEDSLHDNEEEWNVEKNDKINPEQYEGGEQEGHLSRQSAINQSNSAYSNAAPPRKTLGQVLVELKRLKEEEEDRIRREEERI